MQNRILYFISITLTLALGLLSRSQWITLPPFLAAYSGDTLWAMMIYWGIRFLFPKQPFAKSAIFALSFSFVIEFSQLYQADWINDLRSNKLGALILGHGFLWTDLICYSVGVELGVFIDFLANKKSH